MQKSLRRIPCYKRIIEENPKVSLIAAALYVKFGVDLNRLKTTRELYQLRYGLAAPINPEDVEALVGVGVTVVRTPPTRYSLKRARKNSLKVEEERKGKEIQSAKSENRAEIEILRSRSRGYKHNVAVEEVKGGFYKIVPWKLIQSGGTHRCFNCNQRFSSYKKFERHKPDSCTKSVMNPSVKFVGGGFDRRVHRDISALLAAEGISVGKSLTWPPYLAVYDFESCFSSVDFNLGETGKMTKRLQLISFAVNSNVPGFPSHFACGEDPELLFEEFWTYLHQLAARANQLMKVRWRETIRTLNRSLRVCMHEIHSISKNKEPGESSWEAKKRVKHLSQLIQRVKRYYGCLPVIGFNSGNFDLPLIKPFLAKKLMDISRGETKILVVKSGQGYKSILTDSLRFLDVINYVAPGYSLKTFLAAYLPELDVKSIKGHFPYEWMTDYSKLASREFPAHSEFFSSLRGENISLEEYKEALEVWNSLPTLCPRTGELRCMRHYLEWYNRLDVFHLLQACLNLQTYWLEKIGQHPFRDAVSLPGLALRLAYSRKDPGANILLPTRDFKAESSLVSRAFVGGPAIVFLRYSEVGVTRIKSWRYGDEAREVRSVATFDLNSLYVYAMTRCPMPCGNWVSYKSMDLGKSFSSRKMCKFYKEELEWLAWRQKTDSESGVCTQHHIIHQWNGGPVSVGRFPVDGFCSACRTAYQYDGARFHGSCPKCPKLQRHWFHSEEAFLDAMVDREVLRDASLMKREEMRGMFPQVNLVEICSCEWTRQKRNDAELRSFCSSLFPQSESAKSRSSIKVEEMLERVRDGTFFGLLEVDINVPDSLKETYDVFPPFFCHKDISAEILSPAMQEMIKKLDKPSKPGIRLVSALEAENFVIISPLLQFYLQRGFLVTRVHQAIEFTPQVAFLRLGEEIHSLRCAADQDPKLKIQAETVKLAGNSIYGKTCERKDRHTSISYVGKEEFTSKLESSRLKSFECIGEHEEVMEVQEYYRMIQEDTPRSIGAFILGYAKLQILRFAYMLMDFCDERDWSPILMDTDSLMLELSVPNGDIDAIIRPEKREEWAKVRKDFLPCSQELSEQKRHGIFKMEFLGDIVVALGAKCYSIHNKADGKTKTAAKGISKRHNQLDIDVFKDVLMQNTELRGKNVGFRKTNTGGLFQYQQEKVALTSVYCKRYVCDDFINTKTLCFPKQTCVFKSTSVDEIRSKSDPEKKKGGKRRRGKQDVPAQSAAGRGSSRV